MIQIERPISCADAESLIAALGSLNNLSAENADAVARNRETLQPYVSALSDFLRAADAVLVEFATELVALTRRVLAGKRPPLADVVKIRDAIAEVSQALEGADREVVNVALRPLNLSDAEVAAISAPDLAVIRRFLGGK
jgi:hypothetical protein